MSGSAAANSYRNSPAVEPALVKPGIRWRRIAVFGCVAASIAGFSSIVVKAGDDSGVYEVAKSYTTARGTPRFQLPQIFQPSRSALPQGALGYASSFNAQSGIRSDRSKTSIAKSVKVSPTGKLNDEDFEESFLTSRMSYCVRTCDGFYFPIGNPDSGNIDAHEAACARACPGAETGVYVANAGSHGIDDSATRRGQRYTMLTSAYAYRTQYNAACTCNGAPGQARNYSVMTDFTLRAGDLVMSREGLKVFRGNAEQMPYRMAHFGQADQAKLSADERRWVQATEASSLRSMQGANVSKSLRASIDAQVRSTVSPQNIGLRGVERTVAASDGRNLRYVGPDAGTAVR